MEAIATELWASVKEGFIVPESKHYQVFQDRGPESHSEQALSMSYRFLHDRIQQAAYSLIPEEQKQTTHLKVGRQLWNKLKAEDSDKTLFTIVNHLNIAREQVSDPNERTAIAKLNLRASQVAKTSVAYAASLLYCDEGQAFLDDAGWADNYELHFAVAIATIEAEYFNHNLDVAQQLSQETLEKATTLLDRIKVYELKILIAINQNQMNQAIALARKALEPLGIQLPSEPEQIQADIITLRQALALPIKDIAELISLDTAEDEATLAAIRILTNASSAAYIANPTLYPAIVLHTVQQCMTAGHSPLAASAYSWYGALLCGSFNDIAAGYEFGQLSFKLLEKFHGCGLTAKVSNMVNVFIRPWQDPLNHIVTVLPSAIQSGFEEGDVEYALYAAVHYCNYQFYNGSSLATVLSEQERYLPLIMEAKYEFHEGFLRINQQVVENLINESDRPAVLQGDVMDGERCLSQWIENNIVFLVLCFYEAQTRLAYIFEDYAGALEAGEKGWQCRQAAMGTLYASEQNFYYSLALLAGARHGYQSGDDTDGSRDGSITDRVIADQQQLKIWADFSPSSFQHKYDLVEAERHQLLGNQSKAIRYYQRAITGARLNHFLQEEALANELAAKALWHWEQEKAAAKHLQDAYTGYIKWGATTKAKHLKDQYPQLMGMNVGAAAVATAAANERLTNLPSHTITVSPSSKTQQSTISANATLDLAAVLKASQAISGTIDLNELLAKITTIILQNSGGDRCALLLPDLSKRWQVKAITTLEATTLCSEPLQENANLPLRLIQYVKNTRKVVIIDDLNTDLPVIDDGCISVLQ
ncbi:MAG: hypothetical protein AB8B99_11620 [Phormidesmis sp.]